ncbi:C-type lectin 37Db-like [Zeugodacus cucurbitae]|uniref:C-type lectin 37Db-like n=1 Tax=Zeugodacus cucurbitae TaxID=28588 RepID=UPI0023D931D1|nr:C-type lectin 37Db-like [Zeugodacus cucurbitae]
MLNSIKVCLIFLNIFTIFASPSNSNNNENTANYYPFVKIGSKHYFINPSLKMNWYESFDYCRSIGGDLVNIESLEELLALQKYVLEINIGSQLWTDGNDLAREGRYTSHTTGRPLVFVKWTPNNPNNQGNNEDCIEVRLEGDNKTLLMNDNNCFNEYYAICQYRKLTANDGRSFCVVLDQNENCMLRNLAEGFTKAADMFKSCA